ncbi:MAG TPA: FecR family protein, partial [bacterium]|nr:FecR family protein [bacterium]
MKKIVTVLLSFFAFFIVLSAEENIGGAVLTKIQDGVLVYDSASFLWVQAKEGARVQEKDTVATHQAGSAVLQYSDGAEIEISGDTILSVASHGTGKRDLNVWSGKVKAKVKKLQPGEKFFVHTPAAVCAVRGTEFSVEVSPEEETKVRVYEGVVGVMDAEELGAEVLVKEGQESLVVKGKPAYPAQAFKEEPPAEEAAKKAAPAEEKKSKKEMKEAVPAALPEVPEEKKEAEKTKEAPSGEGKVFNMYGNFGAVALTDPDTGETKVYYQLSLLPELALGKLGIGLDLVFYFDENNNIRKGDWAWDRAWEKISYIRWGRKYSDPFYILMGRFVNPVSVGNGFIVSNYSNMMDYPNTRRLGIDFALDRGGWGIEGMISDISSAHQWNDLKTSGFWSGRAYFRPLSKLSLPLFSRLVLGVTGATDREPDGVIDAKKDAINIIGVDAALPIV